MGRQIFRALTTLLLLPALGFPLVSHAVTSSESVSSAFDGNGHNLSFDGRLALVRDGGGWQAMLLRPEATTYLPGGLPDATGPMFSPRTLVFGGPDIVENALAICEQNPARAPYACDAEGADNAEGPFDCYEIWLIDSEVETRADEGGLILRRRPVTVWVSSPKTDSAFVDKAEFGDPVNLSPPLMGGEPTVTADGKLLVYQGHPNNDGALDILMYSTAPQACAQTGWSSPKPISAMHTDPAVNTQYPLAERPLRAADGTPFDSDQVFRGAYPWLFQDGSALIFAAAEMPCVGDDEPSGCGARRNAISVIGRQTTWGIGHVDGGINPDTNQTVRLFYSSPGPETFEQFPVSAGNSIWPFFGTNTGDYTELSFDDHLDENYGGVWHLNESINIDGNLDPTQTPDVSGYFNTGELKGGLNFSPENDGMVGKALIFDGIDDYVEVASAPSLNPTEGVTVEFWIRLDSNPDCDENSNNRVLVSKGGGTPGPYFIELQDDLVPVGQVNVDGEIYSLSGPPLSLSTWTHVAFEYDGTSGESSFWYNGLSVAEETFASGSLEGNDAPLRIGAPGARTVCPPTDGAFAGALDEVSISRYSRHHGTPPGPLPGRGVVEGAGGTGGSAGSGGVGGDGGTAGSGASNGEGGQGGAGGSQSGGAATSKGCQQNGELQAIPTFALVPLWVLWSQIRRRRRLQ